MTQDIAELFKRIDGELESRLAPRGFAKTKHEHHPQAFGNRFSVYAGREGYVRFTWDGKLKCLILRVYRKRSRIAGAILLSLLGKYDSDKLTREILVAEPDIRSRSEEELVRQFAEGLEP